MTLPLLYESHMHTPLCKHAKGDPEEYAAAAGERGLTGIIVTCHNPLPNDMSPAERMAPEEFEAYVALVERARRACEGSVDVRLGLECDYIPELEPWLKQQVGQADFDFLLGSVHPHLRYFRDRFESEDPLAFNRAYFDCLGNAAESGLFDSIAHPDVVKHYYPDRWQPEALVETIGSTLDRIAATGVAMELNTSGLRNRVGESFPGPVMLREMAHRGIPVTLGSDAHRPDCVAAGWDVAFQLLAQAGYDSFLVFLNRRPNRVPLDRARSLVH